MYVLDNGTKWRLAEYHYHYAYWPVARLWDKDGSYYLEVDGMSDVVPARKTNDDPVV